MPQDNARVALPDDATLIDYINSCPHPPRPRDVACAFNLEADLRPTLRRRLRDPYKLAVRHSTSTFRQAGLKICRNHRAKNFGV